MTNDDMRKASGSVVGNDKLTSFLYELMRDHLPPGVVEGIVRSSEVDEETTYTNGWLAQYAQHLSDRLRK